MKEQLLSIAEYIDSLEQRLTALESANAALQDTINQLQEKLDNLDRQDNIEPLEISEPALEPKPEPAPEPKPEPVIDLQPAPCTLQPAPEPEPEPKPEPVIDLHPAPCPLPPVHEPSVLGPQVTNIRQAISLGDRFLFQRELFHNNGELMQKTLDQINDCANMEEALQLIAPFNWDQESTTFKLFMNVLKRRF